jgi:hypothetical protein
MVFQEKRILNPIILWGMEMASFLVRSQKRRSLEGVLGE